MTQQPADNRLLVIAEIGCGPPHMGNRARMRALLHACRRIGLEVHFAGVKFSDVEKKATLPCVDRWVGDFQSRPLGILRRTIERFKRISARVAEWIGLEGCWDFEQSVDRWMEPRWVEEARCLQNRERYTRVLVAYVFHSAFLDAFGPECIKILDTHDIFADRNQRLTAAGVEANWFSTTSAEERRGLMRADIIIAIQENEQRYFEELLSGLRHIACIGHFMNVRYDRVRQRTKFTDSVGFLASENALNVDAVRWFLAHVWPLVNNSVPSARLLIAGRVGLALEQVPEGAEILGPIDSPEEFYGSCLCTINPMQIGTGLKIKTLESLAHGCPVVCTSIGGEGLAFSESEGMAITDDAREFAEKLTKLLRNPEQAASLRDAAINRVATLNAVWLGNLLNVMRVDGDTSEKTVYAECCL